MVHLNSPSGSRVTWFIFSSVVFDGTMRPVSDSQMLSQVKEQVHVGVDGWVIREARLYHALPIAKVGSGNKIKNKNINAIPGTPPILISNGLGSPT